MINNLINFRLCWTSISAKTSAKFAKCIVYVRTVFLIKILCCDVSESMIINGTLCYLKCAYHMIFDSSGHRWKKYTVKIRMKMVRSKMLIIYSCWVLQ